MVEKFDYNGKTYKYVNCRNGFWAGRCEHGDEIVVKPDKTVIDNVNLATDWATISNGE